MQTDAEPEGTSSVQPSRVGCRTMGILKDSSKEISGCVFFFWTVLWEIADEFCGGTCYQPAGPTHLKCTLWVRPAFVYLIPPFVFLQTLEEGCDLVALYFLQLPCAHIVLRRTSCCKAPVIVFREPVNLLSCIFPEIVDTGHSPSSHCVKHLTTSLLRSVFIQFNLIWERAFALN